MNNSMLSVLNQEETKYLYEKMETKRYKKEETIFSPLNKCSSLNMVISGKIKLCKFSTDGNEHIISILEKGDIFGEALVFESLNYPVYVIADCDCTIGIIRRETILGIMKQNEEFTLQILSEFTKKIRILNEKLEYLSYSSVKQRLAKFLVNLSIMQKSNRIKIPFPKQKIAQLLGTSREVVSRNFSAMREEGYFEESGDIVVLDIKGLEELL